MSAKDIILELMSDGREWRGLELVEASGGKLWRSTVYVHLSALEHEGYVTSRYVEPDDGTGRPRPRAFKLTNDGRRKMIEDSRDSGMEPVPA